MRRFFLMVIGCFAVIAAIIGIVLPGMPTTIFLLIALWAFSQSNQRLHAWLKASPIFQSTLETIHQYQSEKVIPLHIKLISQCSAWGSFVVSALLVKNLWITGAILLAALGCSWVMLRTPTKIVPQFK